MDPVLTDDLLGGAPDALAPLAAVVERDVIDGAKLTFRFEPGKTKIG